jgi:hypothetical protein
MEAGSAPSILWHEPVPVQALLDGPILEVLRHRGPRLVSGKTEVSTERSATRKNQCGGWSRRRG